MLSSKNSISWLSHIDFASQLARRLLFLRIVSPPLPDVAAISNSGCRSPAAVPHYGRDRVLRPYDIPRPEPTTTRPRTNTYRPRSESTCNRARILKHHGILRSCAILHRHSRFCRTAGRPGCINSVTKRSFDCGQQITPFAISFFTLCHNDRLNLCTHFGALTDAREFRNYPGIRYIGGEIRTIRAGTSSGWSFFALGEP